MKLILHNQVNFLFDNYDLTIYKYKKNLSWKEFSFV